MEFEGREIPTTNVSCEKNRDSRGGPVILRLLLAGTVSVARRMAGGSCCHGVDANGGLAATTAPPLISQFPDATGLIFFRKRILPAVASARERTFPYYPPLPAAGHKKKKRSEKRTELMRAYIPADTRNRCALLSPFLSKYILLPVRSPQMRHPSTGNATAREFDYDERWLIVAFARCRRRTGGGRRDAVPPALGSLHLQFFSFCRGQRLPTTPLYSLRTPSPLSSSVHCSSCFFFFPSSPFSSSSHRRHRDRRR